MTKARDRFWVRGDILDSCDISILRAEHLDEDTLPYRETEKSQRDNMTD